jgi:hypothetical protein
MSTSDLNLVEGLSQVVHSNLFQVKDIVAFTADYSMYHLHTHGSKYQQEVSYNLCSNLYVAEHLLEVILLRQGGCRLARAYSANSFHSVKHLKLDFIKVVNEFIELSQRSRNFE